jgi:hypothetical protein
VVHVCEFQAVLLLTSLPWQAALAQSVISVALFGLGSCLAGVQALAHNAHCLCIQMIFGIGIAVVCHAERTEARRLFRCSMVCKFVTSQSKAILHTLIPENVHRRMVSMAQGESINVEIAQGLVLFCCLSHPVGGAQASRPRGGDACAAKDFGLVDPCARTIDRDGNRSALPHSFFSTLRRAQAPGAEQRASISRDGDFGALAASADDEFERLRAAFAAFDELVHASLFFKIQHVGDWYIVVCQQIADPFAEPGAASEERVGGAAGRGRGSGGGGEGEERGDDGDDAPRLASLGQAFIEVARRHDLHVQVGERERYAVRGRDMLSIEKNAYYNNEEMRSACQPHTSVMKLRSACQSHTSAPYPRQPHTSVMKLRSACQSRRLLLK